MVMVVIGSALNDSSELSKHTYADTNAWFRSPGEYMT